MCLSFEIQRSASEYFYSPPILGLCPISRGYKLSCTKSLFGHQIKSKHLIESAQSFTSEDLLCQQAAPQGKEPWSTVSCPMEFTPETKRRDTNELPIRSGAVDGAPTDNIAFAHFVSL